MYFKIKELQSAPAKQPVLFVLLSGQNNSIGFRFG